MGLVNLHSPVFYAPREISLLGNTQLTTYFPNGQTLALKDFSLRKQADDSFRCVASPDSGAVKRVYNKMMESTDNLDFLLDKGTIYSYISNEYWLP